MLTDDYEVTFVDDAFPAHNFDTYANAFAYVYRCAHECADLVDFQPGDATTWKDVMGWLPEQSRWALGTWETHKIFASIYNETEDRALAEPPTPLMLAADDAMFAMMLAGDVPQLSTATPLGCTVTAEQATTTRFCEVCRIRCFRNVRG